MVSTREEEGATKAGSWHAQAGASAAGRQRGKAVYQRPLLPPTSQPAQPSPEIPVTRRPTSRPVCPAPPDEHQRSAARSRASLRGHRASTARPTVCRPATEANRAVILFRAAWARTATRLFAYLNQVAFSSAITGKKAARRRRMRRRGVAMNMSSSAFRHVVSRHRITGRRPSQQRWRMSPATAAAQRRFTIPPSARQRP